VDLAVGDLPLQQSDDGPAVGQRLQLGGGAQVAEEIAAFLDAAQREDRLESARSAAASWRGDRLRWVFKARFQCNSVLAH